MSVSRLLLAGAVLAALVSQSVHASSPKFFQAATQADFLKGEVENLSIDARGQLVIGPAIDLVYETAAPFVWTIASAPDGSLYLGTGNEGKVYRIGPDGKGTVFYDSAELEVHAVAVAPDGTVYVGTSPDGKIYKVDKTGTATTFFDGQDKYIWALVVDPRGNVYAATGDKGVIYKIAPDGKGTPFYRTKSTHATALTFDKAGNLIAGTESPGKVIRIDASGKGFVLLDTPFQEIRSLRFDEKGMLYAAAMNGRPSGGAPVVPPVQDTAASAGGRAPIPVVTVSAEITSIAVVDVPDTTTASSSRDERRGVKGGVYRVSPDGLWDQVWESREDVPYDVAFEPGGAPIIATGTKGKLYRLEGDPLRPTLLTRAGAQQVTAFYKDARGRLYFATANPGKLFRLSPERAARGTYESEPRDAQMLATWGSLRWRGSVPKDTQLELFTRSGNTETPDEAWSAWAPASGPGESAPITSPKARYLQWRAVLSSKGNPAAAAGPVLTSVTVAYLQRNLRPTVRSITVHPPGIVFQKPFSTGEPDLAGFGDQTTPDRKATSVAQTPQGSSSNLALGRRTYQKNLQTLVWRADDENDDELSYDVLYRREGDAEWTPLRRGLDEPILVWDTTTVPNGTYFIRVVASDGPSNPAGTALAGERDSSAIQIDHTPPTIKVGALRAAGGRTSITFDVTDADSTVSRVEYSRDGGLRWTAIFPTDGIADSKLEHYELVVDGAIGESGITIRAFDSMNNADTAHVGAPTR
jgi:SMP-30/Gluconolactonase/LRE-like region